MRNRGRESVGSCCCCVDCTERWRAGRANRSEEGRTGRRETCFGCGRTRTEQEDEQERTANERDSRYTSLNQIQLCKKRKNNNINFSCLKKKSMDSTAVTATDSDASTGFLTDTQLSVATGLVLMFGMFWVIGYLLNFLNFAPLRRRRYYPGHEDPHAQASSMSFLEKALNTVSRWTSLDSF
nr:uncharacterized protein LOC113810161 isoform X3 [Penaeus vannamei]